MCVDTELTEKSPAGVILELTADDDELLDFPGENRKKNTFFWGHFKLMS